MKTIQAFSVVDRANKRVLWKSFLLGDDKTNKRSIVSITRLGDRTEHVKEVSEHIANMEFMRLIIDTTLHAHSNNLVLRDGI